MRVPLRSQPSRNRTAIHPALFLLLLAALLALALWTLQHFRHSGHGSERDLVSLLPAGDATTFYANLDTLRSSGYLQLFANETGPDQDYRSFIAETNFDFARDVNALAGAWSDDRLLLLLKGRFDWTRFHDYVNRHGGQCVRGYCSVGTSQPGRHLSFKELQSDVMVAVIGPDPDSAAQYIAPPARVGRLLEASAPEHDPVWVRPAASALQRPNALPSGVRMFAIALQSAQSVTISLGQSRTAAFDLKLFARFEHPTIADTARNQLAIDTKSLELELSREHASADPANLTGLLTAGRFWTQDKVLYGTWPVRKEFLTALR